MSVLLDGIDAERVRTSGTTALICGSSFTGKSVLLSFFINNWVKSKLFDVIVLFTESPNSEPYKKLHPSVIKLFGFHPEIVNLALAINRETNNKYKFAFVLDDVSNIHDKKVLERMITVYRNSGITTIISIQNSRMINPKCRASIHRLICTGNRSAEDRQQLIKTYLAGAIKEPTKQMQELWFQKHTDLSSTGGKYLNYDTSRDTITVVTRPKLSDI